MSLSLLLLFFSFFFLYLKVSDVLKKANLIFKSSSNGDNNKNKEFMRKVEFNNFAAWDVCGDENKTVEVKVRRKK